MPLIHGSHTPRHSTGMWSLTAAATALSFALLSVLGALVVAHDDAARSRHRFETSSASVASTLQLAIQREEDLVVSAGGLVAGNADASEAEFTAWANTVQALQRHPEVAAIGYVVIVTPAQLAGYAAKALAAPSGLRPADGTFTVTPAGNRSFYCFAPLGQERNAKASVPIAFDFCADPSIRTPYLASRDSGIPSYLPFDNGVESTFNVSVPVYRGGTVPTTVAARRADFLGWVGMTVVPRQLFAEALTSPGVSAVWLRYTGGTHDVVFSSGTLPKKAQTNSVDLHDGWVVTTASRAVDNSVLDDGRALAALIAGCVLGLLLAALLYTLGTSRGRALRLVERRTSELRHLAAHDALTGLPNRLLLLERIEHALIRARREREDLAVLYLDLDGFKSINDTLGHAAGDELLREVAVRITSTLRAGDTVGRLGGDEFVVLLEGISTDTDAITAANRIQSGLAEPIVLTTGGSQPVSSHASIGIAVGDRPAAEDLLRDADLALYAAKAAGKDGYVLFAPHLGQAVTQSAAL